MDVKKLFELGKSYPWKRPRRCPVCKGMRLWGHGYAERYFEGFSKALWVKRYLCPECGAVHSTRPCDYLKGFRHRSSVILGALADKLFGSGRSPATVNRYIATLKHMFTKAVEWELVSERILKKVRRARLLKEPPGRLRYLSASECEALVKACAPHLRPVVVTALNTGMRKEEILSLEWDKHVDLKHGFILIDRTKNGESCQIPINRTLRETLQGLVRHIRSPYVFTDAEGRRFRDIKRSFSSALRRAGIKDFRFHDLRHTFASRLVMAGVDLATVKELLGHKSLVMTLRYAHLAPGHKRRAIEVLD